jgi:hypothetical protein
MKKLKQLPKVRIDEIGMFLKAIHAEYQPKTYQEMADFISHHFKVDCSISDILEYEALDDKHKKELEKDWELESRRANHFQSLGTINPFDI